VTVADELELKAVIPDPDALRERLRASGGRERFRARMADRRFDRAGELVARGEVLRVRSAPSAGSAASPHAFLASLGYDVVHAIDRDVEVYDVGGATVRLERYPDMDPLLEVEGAPADIERAIRVTGIGRDAFTADSLADFVRRFEARTGRPAVLAAS
jgi:adenylate cyclase class IV